MNRLISILTLILVIPMFGQAQLPNKWDSGFTIRLSHSGSMSGGFTRIQFSFDQCEYENQSAKMHALKIDKIKSQATARVVNDGWSSSICLGTDCIQGGTSAEMSIADKDIFLEAYDYLQQFALERRPK
jgi:hypothetical protein